MNRRTNFIDERFNFLVETTTVEYFWLKLKDGNLANSYPEDLDFDLANELIQLMRILSLLIPKRWVVLHQMLAPMPPNSKTHLFFRQNCKFFLHFLW